MIERWSTLTGCMSMGLKFSSIFCNDQIIENDKNYYQTDYYQTYINIPWVMRITWVVVVHFRIHSAINKKHGVISMTAWPSPGSCMGFDITCIH